MYRKPLEKHLEYDMLMGNGGGSSSSNDGSNTFYFFASSCAIPSRETNLISSVESNYYFFFLHFDGTYSHLYSGPYFFLLGLLVSLFPLKAAILNIISTLKSSGNF